MFEPRLGKNIEIYVDDMVVKGKVVTEHLEDLSDIFDVLRRHKLRLNASKCSFGVGSNKFLGYMVTHRGIEVNPNQIKAINDLKPPRNAKEVQKLTGMIATLNLFISKSVDRYRPFYLLINKWKGFEWSEDALWRSNNSRSICRDHPSCPVLRLMKSYTCISLWRPTL